MCRAGLHLALGDTWNRVFFGEKKIGLASAPSRVHMHSLSYSSTRPNHFVRPRESLEEVLSRARTRSSRGGKALFPHTTGRRRHLLLRTRARRLSGALLQARPHREHGRRLSRLRTREFARSVPLSLERALASSGVFSPSSPGALVSCEGASREREARRRATSSCRRSAGSRSRRRSTSRFTASTNRPRRRGSRGHRDIRSARTSRVRYPDTQNSKRRTLSRRGS